MAPGMVQRLQKSQRALKRVRKLNLNFLQRDLQQQKRLEEDKLCKLPETVMNVLDVTMPGIFSRCSETAGVKLLPQPWTKLSPQKVRGIMSPAVSESSTHKVEVSRWLNVNLCSNVASRRDGQYSGKALKMGR